MEILKESTSTAEMCLNTALKYMCLVTFHHCWNHTSNLLLIVEEELIRSYLRHISWLSGDLNNISSSLKQWQHNYLHHILLRHTHYHKLLLLLLWNLLKAVRGANPPPSPPPSSSYSPSSPLNLQHAARIDTAAESRTCLSSFLFTVKHCLPILLC